MLMSKTTLTLTLMVFTAPKTAPIPMTKATKVARLRRIVARDPACSS